MTALCLCPSMPDMGPRDPIPTGPVTCVCCGHPLELTCAGHCGKVEESITAAAPARNAEVKRRAEETRPRAYKPKPCTVCRETFQPSGPRSALCEACKLLMAAGG